LSSKIDKSHLLLELGRSLLKIGSIRIGNFTTREGESTPYFIDMKRVVSFPDVSNLVLDCLESASEGIRYSYLCGVPISGLVFCALLANKHQKPLLYPAGESNYKIHGMLRPGSEVLVVDDVSETGRSIEYVVQTVRANGGIVNDALVVIDRLEGAGKILADSGVKLHAFTTTEKVAETLRDNMALSDEEAELIETKPR
jgi:orotate phosphoribosyltransferase